MASIRTRLVITGSRLAAPPMIDLTWRIVRACRYPDPRFPSLLGAFINVGDAGGVDLAVVAACNKYGVPYMCHGVTRTGRNKAATDYIDVWGKPYRSIAYPTRDRYMVNASSHCIAIKNPLSTTHGTDLTYEYALKVLPPGNVRKYLFDPLTGQLNIV